MTILKRAVDEFLERPLRDSNKAKLFTRDALERKLQKLDPVPSFATQPFTHQLATFLLCAKHECYGCFLDPGLGKSWLVLNLHKWFRQRGVADRLLVTVPFEANVYAWEEQAALHTPDLTAFGLGRSVSGTAREEALFDDDEAQVVIVTYAGLLRLVSTGLPRRRGLHVSEKLLARLAKAFQVVAWDESTALMNPQSKFFQVARACTYLIPRRFVLSGTPMSKDPAGLWSQMFAVDRGETLGPTLGLFRAAFFYTKPDPWTGFDTYHFLSGKTEKLGRMLRHNSIYYKDSECADLPLRREIVVPIKLSVEARKHQKAVVEDLIASKGDYRALDNIFLRLRQIASGYVVLRSDSQVEDVVLEFKENPKLDALLMLLAEFPPEDKVVVVVDYKHSGRIVLDALTKAGVAAQRLYSGTKDKKAVLERFKEDPKQRVLVASQSAAYGLNLQYATRMVWFESPASPLVRTQMSKRIHRIGQTRPTYYYDLVVKRSIEEKILKSVGEGIDLRQSIMEGRENALLLARDL